MHTGHAALVEPVALGLSPARRWGNSSPRVANTVASVNVLKWSCSSRKEGAREVRRGKKESGKRRGKRGEIEEVDFRVHQVKVRNAFKVELKRTPLGSPGAKKPLEHPELAGRSTRRERAGPSYRFQVFKEGARLPGLS